MKSGSSRPSLAPTLTETEQLEKLAGYMVVPKDLWPFIKYPAHVRYIEIEAKGGEFRSGGFVLNNPFDTKVRGSTSEKRFIKLQNGFNKTAKDHKEWIAAYEDIEYLYVKGNGAVLTLQRDLQTAVSSLNANIARLAEYSKKLERRIASLESRFASSESR
ncbi:BA71V-C129R [Elysia marginata]|uniref:BA71V-C129R n=1 Tax=Elysia marginata TaxID=1093978 RepID=A0AAV4GTV3_9GAST|nr:BA71V-C129R [Elysia marginata]